jgi:hypothetical protein
MKLSKRRQRSKRKKRSKRNNVKKTKRLNQRSKRSQRSQRKRHKKRRNTRKKIKSYVGGVIGGPRRPPKPSRGMPPISSFSGSRTVPRGSSRRQSRGDRPKAQPTKPSGPIRLHDRLTVGKSSSPAQILRLEKIGIVSLSLVELPANPWYQYQIKFTNNEPGTFVFTDLTGDAYKNTAIIKGNHNIRFNSENPTIVSVDSNATIKK